MRYAIAFLLIAVISINISAQSPSAVLAPTGTLRAIFLGDNPVQGRVNATTGESTGLVPDLVREFARKLGVPSKITSGQDAAAIIDALKNGTADIGFLAYDETRAQQVDFGAAFAVMLNSYLVRANSPIKKTEDVDQRGIRVAAVNGQTQELYVSSHLKNAQVLVFASMPPQPELETLLVSGQVDAFAINRQRSLEAEAASASKLRALPDSFLKVDQAFVVQKGDRSKIEAIEKFMMELRSSGFIKSAIERAKLAGVEVPGT
jgi:polar amino acid transport system substrate-binding protein